MNPTQTVITIGYGILVALSVVGLIVLLRSMRPAHQGDTDHRRLASLENGWGTIVAISLVALLALTIFQIPYGQTKADGPHQVVDVRGQQYAWSISPNTVKAGVPVEFHITSKDVQHGFGLYKGHELLKQVQVPATGQNEQRMTYTFDEPGTYSTLCLEFCGFQHHNMRGQIKVVR